MNESNGTVLVAAASKHGATAEIARVVGQTLAAHGLRVSVQDPAEVGQVDGYRACVVGSAVYGGRWRKEATEFVLHNAEALRARPVWLFSSGPVGEPPKPAEAPADTEQLLQVAAPREHRIFAGKLDRGELGFIERRAVQVVKAPYGDFRDWDAVRAWATGIAAALTAEPATPAA